MTAGIADAIRGLVDDKGISEELIVQTIEEFLLAAYKRKYGTAENAVVKFSEDGNEVALYARKKIVDLMYDEALEIEIEDALLLNEDCEIGDELLIEIDPTTFDRQAIMTAKQRARQILREIQKDTLYSEFKQKEGELVIGYHQREKNGNIYVDLGKMEGILPKRYQSARETYRPNDRIKAFIYEVSKNNSNLSVVLSRTHAEFVQRLFELEVPEVYDQTVEIFKIVRDPGYRTKMAVISRKEDVDPVGACVGLKGVRIQNIVRELEGEKIDVLRYDIDPKEFIRNALSPADVKTVVILDEAKRHALAVVDESQLSLAIGKSGQNVKLANRLVDWNIDVKTVEQFAEMDISVESKNAVNALFSGDHEAEDEIVSIAELPGVPEHIVAILADSGITQIEQLVSMNREEMSGVKALTSGDVDLIMQILESNVDIIVENDFDAEGDESYEEYDEDESAEAYAESDEEYESDEETVEIYECPECGADITLDMDSCPSCGVGLSFEEEEEEEVE